jgi:hypothetical protein
MKTPFGNTVAAIKLAEMVENDKKSRRIVSEYFRIYMEMLTGVNGIRSVKTKKRALQIFRTYYFYSVQTDIRLPVEVKSYLLNVMAAYHRGVQKAKQQLYG